MLALARHHVAILTSVGAIILSLLLIIFFGAWAVSASSEADLPGVLSSAAAGFSGSPPPGSSPAPGDPGAAPRLASDAGGGGAETWWGQAFLVACPLH